MGNIKAKKKKRKYRGNKIDFQTIEISMHSRTWSKGRIFSVE